MAIEQKWPGVAPQLFTSNGGPQGKITISDLRGFKVKQRVIIIATGLPNLILQVKRVNKKTNSLIVGPFPDQQQQGKTGLKIYTDLSQYTTALGSAIYVEEQDKVKLKLDDIESATYEQEPTVAKRVVHVDQFGDFYDQDNPLPVSLSSTVSIAQVEVKGTNGNFIEPNLDGSLNVNIVNTPASNQVEKNIFNSITSVASGVQTQITSYTVPALKTASLHRIEVSGDNFARFDVYLNGNLYSTQRTWYSNFNTNFEYTTGSGMGIVLIAGDTVSIKVTHNRPFLGEFEGRIQVLEIG